MSKPAPAVMTRQDAHRLGLRRYFTGKPCRNGHLTERYVGNGACIDCINGAFKPRVNAFSHTLQAYTPKTLWLPGSVDATHVPELERYLQQCIFEFARARGQMTPELEEAAEMQLARM